VWCGRIAESNPDLLLRIHEGLNPGLVDCKRCYGTAAHICCKKLLLRSVVVILSCLFPGVSRAFKNCCARSMTANISGLPWQGAL
jgi:hypothetical protein